MKKLLFPCLIFLLFASCSSSESLEEVLDCSCGHAVCECEVGCSCQCNG